MGVPEIIILISFYWSILYFFDIFGFPHALIGAALSPVAFNIRHARFGLAAICAMVLCAAVPYWITSLVGTYWVAEAYCRFDALPFILGGISLGVYFIVKVWVPLQLSLEKPPTEHNAHIHVLLWSIVAYSIAAALFHDLIWFDGSGGFQNPDLSSCQLPWSWGKGRPLPTAPHTPHLPLNEKLGAFYWLAGPLSYHIMEVSIYALYARQLYLSLLSESATSSSLLEKTRAFSKTMLSMLLVIPARHFLLYPLSSLREFSGPRYGWFLVLMTFLGSTGAVSTLLMLAYFVAQPFLKQAGFLDEAPGGYKTAPLDKAAAVLEEKFGKKKRVEFA